VLVRAATNVHRASIASGDALTVHPVARRSRPRAALGWCRRRATVSDRAAIAIAGVLAGDAARAIRRVSRATVMCGALESIAANTREQGAERLGELRAMAFTGAAVYFFERA
jgi:hypothetical protein